MIATIEQAKTRYRAAIQGGDQAEFIEAKSALIKLRTGATLTNEQAAYIWPQGLAPSVRGLSSAFKTT